MRAVVRLRIPVPLGIAVFPVIGVCAAAVIPLRAGLAFGDVPGAFGLGVFLLIGGLAWGTVLAVPAYLLWHRAADRARTRRAFVLRAAGLAAVCALVLALPLVTFSEALTEPLMLLSELAAVLPIGLCAGGLLGLISLAASRPVPADQPTAVPKSMPSR